MRDGKIEPSKTAPFGFNPSLFDGYLWKMGDAIYISFIESLKPHCGNFRRLVKRILNAGYEVRIPTPLGRMQQIVEKNKYVKTTEYDEDLKSDVEIWVDWDVTK